MAPWYDDALGRDKINMTIGRDEKSTIELKRGEDHEPKNSKTAAKTKKGAKSERPKKPKAKPSK